MRNHIKQLERDATVEKRTSFCSSTKDLVAVLQAEFAFEGNEDSSFGILCNNS